MKYILFTLVFFAGLFFGAHAQNIVPNYSFEVADSCPTDFNHHTYKYSLGCVGWGQATNATADYFNACDTAAVSIGRTYPIVGVSNNFFGYQKAYQGLAYAGIYTYDSILFNYREYLITDIPALQKDTAYKVTIFVSLADSSRFATNGLGVFFSTYGSPGQFSGSNLHLIPQVDYFDKGIISDTANWTKLSGSFVADSAYTSLIIGCFKNDSELNFSAVNGAPLTNRRGTSYYYIDNVIVEKLSSSSVFQIGPISHEKLYPNPFYNYATLFFDNRNNQTCKLEIYNVNGRLVRTIDAITTNRIRIERNDLPTGFYYYKLYVNNNILSVEKFIIQ
jgi:hypothetical protein